jgi:hypothetical protein
MTQPQDCLPECFAPTNNLERPYFMLSVNSFYWTGALAVICGSPCSTSVFRYSSGDLGGFLSLLRCSCAALQVAVELRSNNSKIKFKAYGYSTDSEKATRTSNHPSI